MPLIVALVHIQDIREDVRDYAKRGPFSPYTSSAQVRW